MSYDASWYAPTREGHVSQKKHKDYHTHQTGKVSRRRLTTPKERAVPPPRQDPPPLVILPARLRGPQAARSGIERFKEKFGNFPGIAR